METFISLDRLRGLAFLALTMCVFGVKAENLTLKEIRAKLIDREFVVHISSHESVNTWELMKPWRQVTQISLDDQKSYSLTNSAASTNVIGKRGVVISVEDSKKLSSAKDVFGKPLDDSAIVDPYFTVIVKLNDDGELIGKTTYFGLLKWYLTEATEADSTEKEITGILAKLIGKTIYPVRYTELLSPTLSMDALKDPSKRALARDYSTKNLTPIKIIDAKLFSAENAVVLKVELPGKQTRMLFGGIEDYNKRQLFPQTTLERMGINVEDKLPKFSAKVISSIRAGEIFVGMPENALYMSWGYPDKTNNYGTSGDQNIYRSSYVYVKNKVVTTWQSMDR